MIEAIPTYRDCTHMIEAIPTQHRLYLHDTGFIYTTEAVFT